MLGKDIDGELGLHRDCAYVMLKKVKDGFHLRSVCSLHGLKEPMGFVRVIVVILHGLA